MHPFHMPFQLAPPPPQNGDGDGQQPGPQIPQMLVQNFQIGPFPPHAPQAQPVPSTILSKSESIVMTNIQCETLLRKAEEYIVPENAALESVLSLETQFCDFSTTEEATNTFLEMKMKALPKVLPDHVKQTIFYFEAENVVARATKRVLDLRSAHRRTIKHLLENKSENIRLLAKNM